MKLRVQVDGQLYEVEVGDLNSRPIQAVVDGEPFAVWPEEVVMPSAAAQSIGETGSRAQSAPWSAPVNGQTEIVTSPLPGDVISVAVKVEDSVEVGQLLCVIESMKMNNSVRSHTPGVIEEIMVAAGEHVNFGQPLMRLRPATPAKE